jgi:phospholipid/cholesterol/gamma-HCH transport system substrate-binding protein
MGRNAVETALGAIVLIVAGWFTYFAYGIADVEKISGYDVKALFFKVGGLSEGSDVRISGIKVGHVVEREIDPETFDAVVRMSIMPEIKLPADTIAAIASEGLLGGKYVRLEPGVEKAMIPAGGTIEKTKGFSSLEDQVGEIIFLATGGGNGGGNEDAGFGGP